MHTDDFRPITGSQLRAARALLRWSQDDLEPVRRKVECGESVVILSIALLLRRRTDVES